MKSRGKELLNYLINSLFNTSAAAAGWVFEGLVHDVLPCGWENPTAVLLPNQVFTRRTSFIPTKSSQKRFLMLEMPNSKIKIGR